MPLWPGDPPPLFERWATIEQDGYFLRRFSMSEHGGTHFSAPASVHPDGKTVDEYQAADLVLPAVVVDVREQCRADRDYALTTDDLAAWESRNGNIPADTVVLLLTGWSERWHDSAAYLGEDPSGALHFPGFGYEAASLLVNERGVAGLGIDTAGVEPGTDSDLSVRRLVLAEPRIVLENLTNLELLPATGAVLVVGLLGLVGGSGSPAAVTAFV